MTTTINLPELVQKCRREMDTLVYALKTSTNEKQLTSLLNNVQVLIKESRWGVLYVLKSVILDMESISGLKNLMQIFIVKMSDLITENNVLKSESLASECLALLKDFWALSSNRHHAITKQVFGNYSVVLYDVLPSMASLYIDLFVASNRSKEKTEVLSKKLYGWLSMDLNERCLKTALLEVSTCTPKTAAFILPVLRKVLLPPPPKKSFMDYLLHFVLLRRWAIVSKDLADVVQINFNVKAPKNFLDWLRQRWHQSREYIPQDKGLKGRRVSELLCSLDSAAVEELIDVFSQCLLSGEGEQEFDTVAQVEDGAAVADLFVIDKSGSGQDGPPSKKRRKMEGTTEFPKTAKDSHPKSNGTGSVEEFVMTRPETTETGVGVEANNMNNSNDNEDAQVNEDFGLGFVVDRKAANTEKIRESKRGKVEVENEKEKEEEEMEIDRSKEAESDTGDDLSCPESGNEKNEKDDHNEDEDSENVDSGGKDDADDDDSSYTGSEVEGDDPEEESDDDEVDSDDVKAVGGESGNDDKNVTDRTNSPTKPSTSPAFPSCVKDPALSYFVVSEKKKKKKDDSKKSEIEIIDGMEIQTIESIEPVVVSGDEGKTTAKTAADSSRVTNTTPKQLKIEPSNDKSKGRRKREASESKGQTSSEMKVSDSTPTNLKDAKTDIDVVDTNSKDKRSRTESGSSASGKESKNYRSPGGNISKNTLAGDCVDQASGEMDEREEPARGSPMRTKQQSGKQVVDTKSKSQERAQADRLLDNGEQKSRRSRPESESSQGKAPANLSPNKRRSEKFDEKGTLESTEQKHEKKEVGSPNKKPELRAESPRKSPKLKAASPKRKREIGGVGEMTMSVPEDGETALENTEKAVPVTEDQVGFVLSQIRSSLNDDVSKKESDLKFTRSSTRLRTKSESSDIQSKQGAKTPTRNARRQTLTGIKAKGEPEKPNSDNHGSAKMLAEWLRKSPAKAEEVEKETAKPGPAQKVSENAAVELNQPAQLSSSDNEITFKKTPKTYTGLAKKRGETPRRILIESKLEKTTLAETSRNHQTPKKVLKKSDSKSPSRENKGESFSNEDESRGSTTASTKTPKSAARNAKLKDNVESGKASQGTPQSKKTPTQSSQSQSQIRKYFLRGTSPVMSPTGEKEESLSEETPVVAPMITDNAPSTPKPARKSPAERRKSLRSSSKQQ